MHVEENKGEMYNDINMYWPEKERKSFIPDLCVCTKSDIGKNDGVLIKIDCPTNVERRKSGCLVDMAEPTWAISCVTHSPWAGIEDRIWSKGCQIWYVIWKTMTVILFTYSISGLSCFLPQKVFCSLWVFCNTSV